ncbi:MAG: acyl carrier protein [Rhodocyclales bacterium GT-UBC]|nr:MAG: acyl carrier protein [Rhodocyclales bacterium GT-UBC]
MRLYVTKYTVPDAFGHGKVYLGCRQGGSGRERCTGTGSPISSRWSLAQSTYNVVLIARPRLAWCGGRRATFLFGVNGLDTQKEVLDLLDDVLSLKGRAQGFNADTVLLGAIPELDSMAVVAIIGSIEERFGIAIPDDEIDGSVFASVGSLVEFVERLANS